MTQANGLITVRLHPTATENEEEFNAWYNLEHVPQVTALHGFVRTRRYFCDKSDIRYLAWYETDDETVEAGAHFQSIVTDPTPWSLRMRKHYGNNRERMNFKLMCEVGNAPVPEWTGLITGIAFCYSPAEIDRGPCYRFNMNHVVEPASPLEMFKIEYENVK